jgi:hypothetical protein
MLKNYFFRPFLIIAAAQLIFACSDKTDVQKAQEKSIDKSIEETARFGDYNRNTHELGSVRKSIEQAANLYERLYAADCPFNSGLVSLEPIQHNTTRQKALAMGRYAALFVYTASYEQNKYANSYLTEVLRISDEIGIRDAFNEDQLKMLYGPNSDADKSTVLIKAYLKATEQMYYEEKALLVSYMVLGGWIQGMKLSYEICGDHLQYQNVSLSLYDQTYSFYNCVRLLEETKDQMDTPMVLMDKLEIIRPDIESLVKTRGDIGKELFESLKAKTLMLEKEINSLD